MFQNFVEIENIFGLPFFHFFANCKSLKNLYIVYSLLLTNTNKYVKQIHPTVDRTVYFHFALSFLWTSHLPYGNFVHFLDILPLFYKLRHFCGAIVSVYTTTRNEIRGNTKRRIYFSDVRVYIERYTSQDMIIIENDSLCLSWGFLYFNSFHINI